VATGTVVVVVGGGEVVVVVLGTAVGCVLGDACDPSFSDDGCAAEVGWVVEGTVVVEVVDDAVDADPEVVVAVAAVELEPGRSCATTTPMKAVKAAAAKAVRRVRRLNRLWARSRAPVA
jgi:hypothetical protein